MNKRDFWKEIAVRTLKAELKKQGLTYEMLSEKLSVVGVLDTYISIQSKLMRGSFTFAWFLACCKALNIKSINLDILYQ